MSPPKLNLKVQNINIESLLKPLSTYKKLSFETANLEEKVKQNYNAKSSQKCCHVFGLLHLY